MKSNALKSAALAIIAILSGMLLWSAPHKPLVLLPLLATLLACLVVPIPGWSRHVIGLGLLLIAVPAAGFQNSFLFELGIQIGIYAALALGLNVVVGLAGLLDLGYAAFFAIGAYTWAIFGSPQANAFIASGGFPLPGWPYFYLFAALAVVTAALTG